MNSKPDILVIQADQLAANYIGAYHNPTDELEQHCLRADKIYSQWAYQEILGYHVPEE